MIPALLSLASFLSSSLGNFSRKCNFVSRKKVPAWIFYVVWPILYILLAIVGEILFRRKQYLLFMIYVIVLILLGAYSWIQWHLCSRLYGFIIILLSFILSLIVFIFMISITLYAFLLLPLILWLLFAMYISY